MQKRNGAASPTESTLPHPPAPRRCSACCSPSRSLPGRGPSAQVHRDERLPVDGGHQPTGDNGCNYGACKSLTGGTLTCAYDSSFCGSTEDWLTAQDVIDAGEECTCEHILNYPNNIGTCSSSGVYSPMALASDCSGGTAVCEAEPGGHYMMGDIQSGVKQFTSCDLKCDASKDHRYDVPTDTYQDCEFYQAQWATPGRPDGPHVPAAHGHDGRHGRRRGLCQVDINGED